MHQQSKGHPQNLHLPKMNVILKKKHHAQDAENAWMFVQLIVFTRLDVSMNKKIMNDLILISSILVISIVAFLAFTISLKNGENAIITVNGEKVAVLDLRKDSTIKIDT